MINLNNYGEIIKYYKGTGSLCQNSQKIPCKFELVQMVNGDLYALCHVSEAINFLNLHREEVVELVGKTEDGKIVKLYQNIITIRIKENEAVIYGNFATI